MSVQTSWVMPDWMEPYRSMFVNTGVRPENIEEMMNDTATTAFSNAPRTTLIIAVESQVLLLTKLYEAGMLVPAEDLV